MIPSVAPDYVLWRRRVHTKTPKPLQRRLAVVNTTPFKSRITRAAPPVVTDMYKEAEQQKFVRLLVNSSCFTFDEKDAVKVADIFVREERAFESVMDMVQIAND